MDLINLSNNVNTALAENIDLKSRVTFTGYQRKPDDKKAMLAHFSGNAPLSEAEILEKLHGIRIKPSTKEYVVASAVEEFGNALTSREYAELISFEDESSAIEEFFELFKTLDNLIGLTKGSWKNEALEYMSNCSDDKHKDAYNTALDYFAIENKGPLGSVEEFIPRLTKIINDNVAALEEFVNQKYKDGSEYLNNFYTQIFDKLLNSENYQHSINRENANIDFTSYLSYKLDSLTGNKAAAMNQAQRLEALYKTFNNEEHDILDIKVNSMLFLREGHVQNLLSMLNIICMSYGEEPVQSIRTNDSFFMFGGTDPWNDLKSFLALEDITSLEELTALEKLLKSVITKSLDGDDEAISKLCSTVDKKVNELKAGLS